MKSLVIFLSCFLALAPLCAQQYFTGLASRWSDDVSEWDIFTEAEEFPTGELLLRWQAQQDFNTWDFQIGEERGFIRTVFRDDHSKWELVGPNNEVITMRQLWSNDRREWRITDNKINLTFKSRWGNRADEWILREESYGNFHVYSRWEGDARDWIIVDEMNEEVSTSFKMSMIFLALLNTIL